MSISSSPSPLSNIIAAKTYNAAWFSGSTKEAQITASIVAAKKDGALYVYIPANMLPYNAALVTFDNTVHMLAEGHTDASVFHVLAYGTAGDGVADDTTGINMTHAACVAAGGGIVCFSGGTFKITSTIIVDLVDPPISVEWVGCFASTIIKPSAVVTDAAFKLSSGSTDPHILARFRMRGFRVDGSNTSGITGIRVGDNAANLSTYIRFDDVDVYSFGGAGGIAWHVKNQIAALFVNCYGSQSTVNLNIGKNASPALPTTLRFISSHFRDGLGKGVVIEQAVGVAFLWSIIEGNLNEGVYIVPTSGKNVLDVDFDTCWFEGNYNSDASKYHLLVDGSAAGTVSVRQRNCRFAGAARAAYYTYAHNLLIDSPSTINIANQIVVDLCDGVATNEQPNNSPFSTILTVTNSSFVLPSQYMPVWDQASGSPSYVINVKLGDFHFVTGTAGAFTINNPINDTAKTNEQTIHIKNSTGGALGAVTWDTKYKLAAWVNPATGFSRSITFRRDSNNTNWYEIARTPADVPN